MGGEGEGKREGWGKRWDSACGSGFGVRGSVQVRGQYAAFPSCSMLLLPRMAYPLVPCAVRPCCDAIHIRRYICIPIRMNPIRMNPIRMHRIPRYIHGLPVDLRARTGARTGAKPETKEPPR